MNYDIESINKRNDRICKIKSVTQKVAFMLLIILVYNILLVIVSNANKAPIEMLGYKAYIISTDSMSPNVRKNDMIIVKKSTDKDLKVNNIITFRRNHELITHRIIEVINDGIENSYITKGDNNNIQDSEEITSAQIEGKVILSIPYIGRLITIIKDKFFMIYVIIISVIIYFCVQKIHNKKKVRREKKKIEDQKFKDQKSNN